MITNPDYLIRVAHVSVRLNARVAKLSCVQSPSTGILPYRIGFDPFRLLPYSQFHLQIITAPNKEAFQRAIVELDPLISLYHTHNEPDSLVTWTKEVTKKPVLWDVNDLRSLHYSEPSHPDELAAAKDCSGILTTTALHLKRIWDIPTTAAAEKPFCLYRPFCPSSWHADPISDPEPNSIAIATGLSAESGHFRNWLDTFNTIADMGFTLKAFCGLLFLPLPYITKCKVVIHPPTHAYFLIRHFAKCEVGLLGSPHDHPLIRVADPNKLYEYIAAGIPSICLGRNSWMAKIVEEEGLGIVIDSISELPDAMNRIRKDKWREKIRKLRHLYCAEGEGEKVRKFYESLL